jgi:hypothetical protein
MGEGEGGPVAGHLRLCDDGPTPGGRGGGWGGGGGGDE